MRDRAFFVNSLDYVEIFRGENGFLYKTHINIVRPKGGTKTNKRRGKKSLGFLFFYNHLI